MESKKVTVQLRAPSLAKNTTGGPPAAREEGSGGWVVESLYSKELTFTTLIDHFTSLHAREHWFIVTNL